jgi:hypothetical protein
MPSVCVRRLRLIAAINLVQPSRSAQVLVAFPSSVVPDEDASIRRSEGSRGSVARRLASSDSRTRQRAIPDR